VLFRTLVAEGLCKLILCGAITSHKLFTRLILIWCNPVNDANTKMKTILGMFFPLYASLSRTNQVSVDSSVPTLRPKYSFWSKKNLKGYGIVSNCFSSVALFSKIFLNVTFILKRTQSKSRSWSRWRHWWTHQRHRRLRWSTSKTSDFSTFN